MPELRNASDRLSDSVSGVPGLQQPIQMLSPEPSPALPRVHHSRRLSALPFLQTHTHGSPRMEPAEVQALVGGHVADRVRA